MPLVYHPSMKSSPGPRLAWRAPLFLVLALGLLNPASGSAQSTPATATVTITDDGTGSKLSPRFMGLSYEMSLVLPKNGKYYFDANDKALVNTFHTLGIKSLRVGAAAVDYPKVACSAGKGHRLSFCLCPGRRGEGDLFLPPEERRPGRSPRGWRPISPPMMPMRSIVSPSATSPMLTTKHLRLILPIGNRITTRSSKRCPTAMFDGPSVYAGDKNLFPEKLADAMVPGGHMAMISDHYYVMGNSRDAEKNLPSARAHFLSNDTETQIRESFRRRRKQIDGQGHPLPHRRVE